MTKESPEVELLLKLSKLMGLKVTLPSQPTREEATLDFAITGRKIKIKEEAISKSPSDHMAVSWTIEIEAVEKRKLIKNPSRPTADEISLFLLNSPQVHDAKSFLEQLGLMRAKNKRHMWKIIRPRVRKDDGLIKKL